MRLSRYRKYEQGVKKAFLDSLREIDASMPVEDRRMMFCAMVRSSHWGAYDNYVNVIYRDVLNWSTYDGKVTLDYQPIYTTKLTRFEFNYPKELLT